MDTTTGNPFAELERLEGLEPFATHQEILTQLRAGGEKESDDGQKAAPQLPRTKLPRFSEAEVHAFRNEGWTLVAPRARTRPSEAPSCQSVEAVAPRALLTGVPPQRSTLAAPPTEKKFWRYLRWGALGALGAIVLSKLASRR